MYIYITGFLCFVFHNNYFRKMNIIVDNNYYLYWYDPSRLSSWDWAMIGMGVVLTVFGA